MATPDSSSTNNAAPVAKKNNNYTVLLDSLKPSAITITDDYIGVRKE